MVTVTVGDIINPLRYTAFNPPVSITAYLILRKLNQDPTFLLNLLPTKVHTKLLELARRSKVTGTLKVLVILGVVSYINKYLSKLSFNNYHQRSLKPKSEEIIVVTGGSGGIGSLVIQGLLDEGYTNIVNLDMAAPSGSRKFPPQFVKFFKIDLTSAESIAKVAGQVRSEVGNPTVLLNNAGTGIGKTILSSTAESLNTTFYVNTISAFLLTKEFLPSMISENYGHVLVTASMASFITPPQMVDYCASKAAILAFADGLRQEVKHRFNAPGIRVSSVHPNWVKTPLTTVFGSLDHFYGRQLEPEQVSNKIVEQITKGDGGMVFLPAELESTTMIRSYPYWLQEQARDNTKDMIVKNKDF